MNEDPESHRRKSTIIEMLLHIQGVFLGRRVRRQDVRPMNSLPDRESAVKLDRPRVGERVTGEPSRKEIDHRVSLVAVLICRR